MLDRNRLAQLLGMLGSDHAGERDNAGRLAVRMVKEAGLTWPEVLEQDRVAVEAARVLVHENEQLREELVQLRAQRRVTPTHWREPENTTEQIEQATEWSAVLTDWEREFITSIAARWRLTVRQQARLDEVTSKIAAIARARGLA